MRKLASLVAALVLAAPMAILTGDAPALAAGPTVLTFDDLAVPAGGRKTLNTQYSSQGVTFNDVMAIDYSQPPFPAGFAHSGTVGIEQCFAVEFCASPIRASFTAGQLRVKAWVGFSYAPPSPVSVRMTAFDANQVSVGSSLVTVPASTAVTPITRPLEVTVSSPTIRSIEIGVPNGYTNALAVDDLEFSAAGPPPPCAATAVPTVQLTHPAGEITVQHDEFLLEGTVSTGGAPIESAVIVNFAQGGTRQGQLYPTLIHPDGRTFGPVRYSGLLFPGQNKIIVTAKNCLGTGASETIVVTWAAIPGGSAFRMLGLEVTQGVQLAVTSGVQTPTTFVPLIAATANSFKRTFVRVYLNVSGVSRVTGVAGRLTASLPGGALPGGPATVPSMNTITVDATATVTSARSSLATSLNFELPREWLSAGQLHLQLDHLTIEGAQSALPCIGCDNPGVQGLPGQPLPGPALVRFHTVPPVRLWLVGVPYMIGTTVISPRQLDFDMLASYLRRAFPTAEVQITQASMQPLAGQPANCHVVNALLSQWAAMLPAVDARTRFYGLIPDNNTKQNFVGACSESMPGQFASGSSGAKFPEPPPIWDTDGSYADAYGAHEIAHMYGRLHPGFCAGQDRGDPNYPYLNGSIGGYLGNSVVEVQGFDAGDAAFPALKDPFLYDWHTAHDLMSYCPYQWPSDYTYRGILQNLCQDDPANCPDQAQVVPARLLPNHVALEASLPAVAISISGTLTLATGKVALDPLWARAGLTPTTAAKSGVYSIEMRDVKGRVLARHRFLPKVPSDQPTGATARIREVVPFPAATARIVIIGNKKALASVAVSKNAPKVTVLSPNGGEALDERVTVRWRGTDADKNRLWYTVLYRPDGKQTIPIATGLSGTTLSVGLSQLPGGGTGSFEVIATDGVRTGSDRSDKTFKVPAKAPRVSIASPAKGAELVEGQSIAFLGTVIDLQDGQLKASQLVWTSSLQGRLGTGPALTAALVPGKHTITLTATNAAGLPTMREVVVSVRAIPPLVAAQLLP